MAWLSRWVRRIRFFLGNLDEVSARLDKAEIRLYALEENYKRLQAAYRGENKK